MTRRLILYFVALVGLASAVYLSTVSAWYLFALGVVYVAWALNFGRDVHVVDDFMPLAFAICVAATWPLFYPMWLALAPDEIKEHDCGKHRKPEANPQDSSAGQSASDPRAAAIQAAINAALNSAGPAAQAAYSRSYNAYMAYCADPSAANRAALALTAGSDIRTGERRPLEVVESDMPILAHRAARLRSDFKGVHFASLNDKFGTFGVDADAMCAGSWRGQPHDAPDSHCECGFYAVPADIDSWHDQGTVDLLVELSGTVIEHEHGYRAGHQRVLEVTLPACQFCGKPSEYAVFSMLGASTQDRTYTAVGFSCAPHAVNDGRVVVNLEDLSRQLGVPVR